MVNEFRNIVFEGGGSKGIAYGGALSKLDEIKILSKITRVAGSSSGAINAVLLSLGYTSHEIRKIVEEKNFNDFADDGFGVIIDTIRLVRRFGWHKGKHFYHWIGEIIKEKTGKENLTFKELHELGKEFRDLYIVGTNLSKQVSEVYSHETTPDLEIRGAVRISMSIPLFFQAVFRGSKVLVDGGIASNYPINIFDREKYVDNHKNCEKVEYNSEEDYVFNHETLGFRIDTKDEILYNKAGWSNAPKKIKNLSDYIKALWCFTTESANKKHLHKNDWNRTIFIDAVGVKTTDFDLSKEKIKELIKSGEKGVEEHFEWRNGEQGMDKP